MAADKYLVMPLVGDNTFAVVKVISVHEHASDALREVEALKAGECPRSTDGHTANEDGECIYCGSPNVKTRGDQG